MKITTRKMQMFYATLLMLSLIGLFCLLQGITFTGQQMGDIIMWLLFWVALMAGMNVGEHFSKVIAARNSK